MRQSTMWLWSAGTAAALASLAAAPSLAAGQAGPASDRPSAQATPTAATPGFRATGNEPFWRLDIANGEITLLTDLGKTRTVLPAPAPVVKGGVRIYSARDQGRTMTVTIADRPCVDTMSGMPHPNTVAVAFSGTTLQGCGGDPATLLHGEWLVNSIGGAPIVKGTKPSIAFGTDGRIAGMGSCNRFTSGFTLTGEGLTIQPPAATMMACVPDEAMKQEGALLKLLESVTSFAVADGVLTLKAADGRAITARRP